MPLLAGAGALQAAEDTYRTDYKVTLAGLPIARATFITELAAQEYRIKGSFKSAGIANIVASISAQTDVSGKMRDSRMEATHYSLLYRKGKKRWTYDVRMRSGDVTQSDVTPEPRTRHKDWIPVTEADLKSVLDPLSGLIISEKEAVCPRTLPIYDGESRMDLVLSPKGTKTFSSGGMKTEATVCSIRYVPKSGFRKGRDDIEYLARASGMEIWFAKTNGLKLYAPVYARIPTRYGSIDITAVKFGG